MIPEVQRAIDRLVAAGRARGVEIDTSGLLEPLDQTKFDHLFPQAPRNWKRFQNPYAYAAYDCVNGLRVLMDVGMEYDGKRWLHVSLSRKGRLPSYDDMCAVKNLFIGPDKMAIQVFVPSAQHVNIHPTCLHLWHCIDGDVLPDFTQGTGSI